MKIAYLAPIGCLLLASGCLTFSGGQMESIAEPQATSAKPTVEITVGEFKYRADGGQLATSYRRGKMLNERLMGIWKDRGYIREFTSVERSEFSGKADYEITLDGDILLRSPVGLQVISGLTLFIIPNVGDTRIDARYTVRDTTTGEQYSSAIKDNYKTVTELLFLPVTPFAAVGKRKMYNTLASHLYKDFEDAGAFKNN